MLVARDGPAWMLRDGEDDIIIIIINLIKRHAAALRSHPVLVFSSVHAAPSIEQAGAVSPVDGWMAWGRFLFSVVGGDEDDDDDDTVSSPFPAAGRNSPLFFFFPL